MLYAPFRGERLDQYESEPRLVEFARRARDRQSRIAVGYLDPQTADVGPQPQDGLAAARVPDDVAGQFGDQQNGGLLELGQ